jgi:hypothetical protein
MPVDPPAVPVDACFFVQLKYRAERRGERPGWVTMAAGTSRGQAIEYAAEVYRNVRSPSGEFPQQVRVVSESGLRAESGPEGVERAYRDLSGAMERQAAGVS